MDTYYPPEPGPAYIAASRPDWKASLLVLAIAIGAWAMLNLWSVSFVAHSILAAGVVPTDTPEWQVFGLATGLQAGVGLLGLLSPLFFQPFRLLNSALWVFCLIACLTVVAFEAYHQVFRGLQLSTGVGFERAETAELERMENEIGNLGRQIPVLYEDKLKALIKWMQDANDGRDRTGQPGCGRICQSRTDLYENAQRRYSHLASSPVPPATGKTDLRARIIDNRYRFGALKAAEASLTDFYRAIDGSEPPRQVTEEIARLGENLVAKEHEYAGISTIDAKNIAMVRSAEAFSQIASGRLPRQDIWLPLAYGCLPAIVVTMLGIFIRLIFEARRQPVELIDLHRQLATEQEAAPLLRKLVQVRSGNFIQLLRARFRRWDQYCPGWQHHAKRSRQRHREPTTEGG